MSVRLEDIEHVEWSLDDLRYRYLREHGWELAFRTMHRPEGGAM
jgi:hypothetical protein